MLQTQGHKHNTEGCLPILHESVEAFDNFSSSDEESEDDACASDSDTSFHYSTPPTSDEEVSYDSEVSGSGSSSDEEMDSLPCGEGSIDDVICDYEIWVHNTDGTFLDPTVSQQSSSPAAASIESTSVSTPLSKNYACFCTMLFVCSVIVVLYICKHSVSQRLFISYVVTTLIRM